MASHASDGRTLLAAVLFADLVGYSKRSVTDQMALKDAFRSLVLDSLAHLSPASFVLVDTGDGAGIAFLRDPEHALYAALRLRHSVHSGAAGSLRLEDLRIGINLGPVRRAVDVNGRPNLVGDGVNAAERIMSFAVPGDATCSRSFHDAVSCLHESYPELFEPLGRRADKHGRDHEVFRMRQSASALAVAATSLDGPAAPGHETPPGPRIPARAMGIVAFVLAAGAAGWLSLRPVDDPAPAAARTEATEPVGVPPAQPPAGESRSGPAGSVRDEGAPATASPAGTDAFDGARTERPTVAKEAVEAPAPGAAPAPSPADTPRRAPPRPAVGPAMPAKCSMLIQKASVGELTPAERSELRSGCR